MQIIGKSLDKGFTYDDLKQIIKTCDTKGIVTELYNLNIGIKDLPEYKTATDAQILILRNGVSKILGNSNKEDLYNEHIKLNWDSKAFMYGGVVNKKARHNLCYDNVSQEPDYEAGKGRIIAFDDIPLTKQIKGKLTEYFGEKAKDLVAEGNLYYNINYNDIVYHGDSERKIVIAIRLGNNFPLRYQPSLC